MLFSLFMLVTGWVIGVFSVLWLEEYTANVPYTDKPKVVWYSEPFARNNRLVIQHPEPKGSVTIGEGQTIDDIKYKIK